MLPKTSLDHIQNQLRIDFGTGTKNKILMGYTTL